MGVWGPRYDSRRFSRRDALKVAAAAALGSLRPARAEEAPAKPQPKASELLDEIERRACLYFYEQGHPVTGLVLDRVRTDGVDARRVASVAATGFGLSALCIAHERGYLKKDDAEQRVERTLDFFARRAFSQRGFYFHFLDCVSGQRAFRVRTLVSGYNVATVRRTTCARAFRQRLDQTLGERNYSSCRLALDDCGRPYALSWLDTGERFFAVSMGRVCRAARDVPVRNRLDDLSDSGIELG